MIRRADGTAPPSPAYLAESQSESLKRILWIAAGLPTLFLLMRCYTRIYLRRVFGLDDYFMVAAVVCEAHFLKSGQSRGCCADSFFKVSPDCVRRSLDRSCR